LSHLSLSLPVHEQAEQWGILFMWKALEGLRNGHPVFDGKMANEGLSIEEVVAPT
jgi:hypothetical protein